MRVGKPDLVIWRSNDEEIQKAKKNLIGTDSLAGFFVTQNGARFLVYDKRGTYLATENRTGKPVVAREVEPEDAEELATARLVLKHPTRLASIHLCKGAAINLQANYTALTEKLMAVEKSEYYMVGTSRAAEGGPDVAFMDVVKAPQKMQDIFLDTMKQVRDGRVLDWKIYDHEAYRAACSYRLDDFCGWLLQASGAKMEREEVRLRIAVLAEKERYTLISEALSVLAPSVVYLTEEDVGLPEFLDPKAHIDLPASVITLLS